MVMDYGYYGISSAPPTRVAPFVGPQVDEARPKRPGGVYIDWGPQLPDSYPVDRVDVLIRDPFWVCIYWLLEGPKSERRRRHADGEPGYRLVIASPSARYEYDIERKCPFYWVKVEPGLEYTVRIVVREEGKTFEVCRSRAFRTPRPWVKPAKGKEVPQFVAELVERFGYRVGPPGEETDVPLGSMRIGHTPPMRLFEDGPGYPLPTSNDRGGVQ
jgi:hypothetical protein